MTEQPETGDTSGPARPPSEEEREGFAGPGDPGRERPGESFPEEPAGDTAQRPARPQEPEPAAPPWWPGGSAEGGAHIPGVRPEEGAPSQWRPETGPAEADRPPPGIYQPEAEPVYRLSPLTMVTAPIRYLKNFLPVILIALFVGTFNPAILGSAFLALIVFLASGIITYQTFRYQVGSERLEIRSGLLNRSRRSIPLERIRGVDVTSTLLHRMLGLAVVKVEAAAGGPASEEGTLDAVTRIEAERLRRLLLHRRQVLRGDTEPVDGEAGGESATGTRADEEAEEAEETVYFTVPPRWYLYGALSLGYLLTPFAAFAALLGFLGQVGGELLRDLGARVGTEARELAEFLGDRQQELPVAVLAVAAVLLVLLLMPVFAVVTYTVNHWGFTLRRRGNSLVAERGMFTRHSVTLELRRIRGHEITDTPLERLGKAARLRAVVTGLGETATRAVLLPIGARTRLHEVVGQALTPFRGELAPHPPAARARRLFRAVVPFLVLGVVLLVLEVATWMVAVSFLLAALGVPLGLDRYRSLGHGDDGVQLSVRSGSLSRSQAVVGRSAVIGWRWSQTLFQRRAGLVTLEASVGAGSGGYAAIDMDFRGSIDYAEGITPQMVRPFVQREGREGEEERA